MSERVGIGVLCYGNGGEIARNVATVRAHCHLDYALALFDNTESDEVGEWARHHAADAVYVRSPYNVGCSRSRNHLAATFAAMGSRYFIVQDQDVRWVGDAAAAMRATFAAHPKTGVVSWRLAVKQMGNHKWDATGQLSPPESPGMCCMYDMAEVRAGAPPLRGWCPEYFAFRFDSDRCFCAHVKGYGVRIADPGSEPNLVRHDHPHSAVKRYPWMKHEQARSRAIFARRAKQLGFPAFTA